MWTIAATTDVMYGLDTIQKMNQLSAKAKAERLASDKQNHPQRYDYEGRVSKAKKAFDKPGRVPDTEL